MKILKTTSGKKTLKISKKEWENIGKKQGWMRKAQDLENAFETYRNREPVKPVYVSVYETSRAYGGPEEGGWWYTDNTLVESKKFYDKEEAEAFAEALRSDMESSGANDEDMHSSKGMDGYPDPSGGDPMYDHSDADIPLGFAGTARNYFVEIEDRPGESSTTERPHYE